MKPSLVAAGVALVLVAAVIAGSYLSKEEAQESTQAQRSTQLAQQTQQTQQKENPFLRTDRPSRGPLLARVQITEFFDPACEACRAFHPYVKQIVEGNGGAVRLTLRYAAFHKGSEYVIRVLESARRQGQDVYWKTLEAVLASQPQWADHARPQPQRVWEFLGDTGLDIERAKRDMIDASISRLLKQDTADIVALDVRQTPTFFVNGTPLRESSPEGLAARVAQELASR